MKIKLVLIALAAGVIVGFIGIVLIKNNNKELDKISERAAQHDFLPGIQMKNEILLEGNEAQLEYSNKLVEIKNGEYHMAEDLAAQLELHAAIRTAQQNLTEAEKGLAITKIQTAEATHKLTRDQAAQARVDLEKQSLLNQAATEEKFYKQKIADYDNAIAKGIQNGKDLSTKKEEAQKKFDAVEIRRAKITKDDWEIKNSFTQTLEDLKNEMVTNETAISNAQKRREELTNAHKPPPPQ